MARNLLSIALALLCFLGAALVLNTQPASNESGPAALNAPVQLFGANGELDQESPELRLSEGGELPVELQTANPFSRRSSRAVEPVTSVAEVHRLPPIEDALDATVNQPFAFGDEPSAGPKLEVETTDESSIALHVDSTVPDKELVPEPQLGTYPADADPSVESTDSSAATDLESSASKPGHRFSGIRDFHEPLEAEPGWIVDPPDAVQIPRESLLDVQLPRNVAGRAQQMLEEATRLADRGALYSARQQFMRVLRVTCQSLDAQLGRSVHTKALVNGLRALEEAEDFALSGNSPEADIHLRGFIEGHRTPVLKSADPEDLTALIAMQRYYKFAYQQLSLAGNDEPVASNALFSLGRIEALLSEQGGAATGGGPQALALYHAAVTVNARNSKAANELGVLLARRGRTADALGVLKRGATAAPSPTLLNNLAVIHHEMGDAAAAGSARHHALRAGGPPKTSVAEIRKSRIKWVSPEEFAQSGSNGDLSVAPLEPIPHDENGANTLRQPAATRSRPRTAARPDNRSWDF